MPALLTPQIGVLALQGDVAEHLRALAAVGARPVLSAAPTSSTRGRPGHPRR